MNLFTRYYDTNLILKRALDIAYPGQLNQETALFYIHGGGWSGGARDIYHEHLQHFSRQGYLCASAGYRLAPGANINQQMEDVFTGYDLFQQYIREHELDIRHIIVLGSSAGAHLASLLALTEPETFAPKLKLNLKWTRPSACVAINGPASLEHVTEEIRPSVEKVMGTTYKEAPELFRKASPDHHVDEYSPDFLFILAGLEKFFPHKYVYEMSEKLKQFGHRAEVMLFPEAEHGFFYLLRSELQLKALPVLEQFVKSYG